MVRRWNCAPEKKRWHESQRYNKSGNLLPEGDLAGSEQGVFAGVPAEEVGSLGVGGVVGAGGPDFVEEEEAGLINGVVQVVLETAFFFAGGSDEGANFGFK